MLGTLLDGTECQILLDTGATKSFMSKSYYMQSKLFHFLPKFASKTQRIQVESGKFFSTLFVIPLIVDIQRQRIEVYTFVSEMHENVHLVLGIKNIFELDVNLMKDI